MNNKNKEYLTIIILVFISLFLRYLTMPEADINYSFDAGNYILAIDNYSIEDHRPHAPGYFLFIKALELTTNITGNAYSSYFFLSNLFIALSVPFLFLILRRWLAMREAVFISLVFITNPIIWFYANIPETYSFDVLFALSMAYYGLSKRWVWLVLPILALGTGVRISSGVLLLPLAVFLIYNAWKSSNFKLQNIFVSLIASLVLFFSWFLPMISTSGGLENWYHIISSLNPFPDSREAFSVISIAKNTFYVALYIFYFSFALFCSYLLCLFQRKSTIANEAHKKMISIVLFWILPGLLFFVFYYYVKGYLLLLAGGVFVLLSIPYVKRKATKLIFIVAIGLQLIIFFYFPYEYPGLDYQYKGLKKEMSSQDLFTKRIFSDLSFSNNQIKQLDTRYSDVKAGIDSIVKMKALQSGKTILIDQSVGVFARGFQPLYPNIRFAEIPNNFDDNYQYFYGIKSKTVSGLRGLIPNTIIIATKDADTKYFEGMKRLLFSIGNLNFSVPIDNKYEAIYERYIGLNR